MRRLNIHRSILLLCLFAVHIAVQAQNTTLSGQLKGLSDGTVTLFYNKDGVSKNDTLKAVNGKFTWKVELQEPIMIALAAGADNYYFFADPGHHMELRGINDSVRTYTLQGSPMQKDATYFAEFTKDLTLQRDVLFKAFRNASADEEKATIQRKRDELGKQHMSRVTQFIAEHPKSSYSLYLIDIEKDYEVIRRLYRELHDSAKQTKVGKRIAERIETLSKSQIGVQMMDFTQTDTSGRSVRFNQFKGQYILVDFWASWCAPCRAENPNLLKAYQIYKDKGFTVIGISLDDNEANWKKAIRDDKLPWTQLSDLKGWENELAIRFGIRAIPSNFLIDPSGKIVAKDLRGEMLEKKLSELLN